MEQLSDFVSNLGCFITVCRDPIGIIYIVIEIYSFTYVSFLVCRRGSGFVFFEVVTHMTFRYSIRRGKRAGFLTFLSLAVPTHCSYVSLLSCKTEDCFFS